MKSLYDPAHVSELQTRLARLQPTSERRWGRMTAPQMLAHCAVSFEIALGERTLPRLMIGRVIGGVIKKLVLRDDTPIRRNTPTAPDMVVSDQRNLDVERERLRTLLDRFASGGPSVCTTAPHAFFGRMTPNEWAILGYKHLDHHFRQFSA